MISLKKSIQNSIKLKKKIFSLKKEIDQSISKIYLTLESGNKVLICGNGGSAAEAQHLAAEFLVRLNPKINRKSFPIIALALDTSTITACGNDFGFQKIFSRNLDGIGNPGDLLLCLSTSGNSNNIIQVLKTAKKKKIYSMSLLGRGGGKAKKISDHIIIIPSANTALIQEEHLFLGHYMLNEVEKKLLN